VPTLDGPCPSIAGAGAMLALDCAVTYGISGAPVLSGPEAGARLVAVVSAMGRTFDNRDVALTVRVEPAIGGLLDDLATAPFEAPQQRPPG